MERVVELEARCRALLLALLLIHPAAGGRSAAPLVDADQVQQITVYKAGESGSACVRTPILLQINDGVLLAFGGARYGKCSDYQGRYIFVKRSNDNGASWSNVTVVTNVTHQTTIERGDGINPGSAIWQATTAAGADGSTVGTVWFGWVECFHKCTVPYQFVKFSKDGGLSWSPPHDITNDVMALSKFAFGPGYGLYLPALNRLLMCGHYLRTSDHHSERDVDASEAESPRGAACIFSDNNGETWRAGLPVPVLNTTYLSPAECQPVQLANGSLLLSARDYNGGHHPIWAISDDGGESWHSTHAVPTVFTATCDASLLAVKNSFYYSRPNSVSRRNLTISVTSDYGTAWSTVAQVWPSAAAYSCLSPVNSSFIGVMYEGGTVDAYEAILFAAIRIQF